MNERKLYFQIFEAQNKFLKFLEIDPSTTEQPRVVCVFQMTTVFGEIWKFLSLSYKLSQFSSLLTGSKTHQRHQQHLTDFSSDVFRKISTFCQRARQRSLPKDSLSAVCITLFLFAFVTINNIQHEEHTEKKIVVESRK